MYNSGFGKITSLCDIYLRYILYIMFTELYSNIFHSIHVLNLAAGGGGSIGSPNRIQFVYRPPWPSRPAPGSPEI